MESPFLLTNKEKTKSAYEFLNEISLRLDTNIELINVIAEVAQEDANLLGALLVLQRDIEETNNYIFKYLGND